MNDLIGDELDKDESFWGHETWESDGSAYETEEGIYFTVIKVP